MRDILCQAPGSNLYEEPFVDLRNHRPKFILKSCNLCRIDTF